MNLTDWKKSQGDFEGEEPDENGVISNEPIPKL